MRSTFKRVVIFGIAVVFTCGLLGGLSWTVAKQKADAYVEQAQIPIFAPLGSRFIFGVGEDFSPRWMFRYELDDDSLSDYPFQVQVSLFGRLLRVSGGQSARNFEQGEIEPEPGKPRPLLVLLEQDPGLLGADSPTFALYADGTVIYRPSAPREPPSYFSAQLSDAERDAFMTQLGDLDAFQKLDRAYEVKQAHSRPTTVIHLWQGKKSVFVYGQLRPDKEVLPTAERAQVPPVFLQLFDHLVAYRHPQATPWLPALIEVQLQSYDRSPEPPLPWPNDFPPFSEAHRRRELYLIFLPQAQLPQLRALAAQLQPQQAIALAGQKWSLAIRYPFPQEYEWEILGTEPIRD